jgi:hypothetical protein
VKRVIPFLLAVCLLAFAVGLFQIFQLRFETGDVYPEYSSLRSDPLGTMALCESLGKMPGLSVRRDYSANNQLPHGRDTTYLHLAAATYEWSRMDESLVKEIEGFVASGGRLAISFFPETVKPFRWFDYEEGDSEPGKKSDSKKDKKQQKQPDKKKMSKETKELLRRTSLKERWGLDFAFLPQRSTNSAHSEEAINETDLPLPAALEWHGAIVFTNLPASWQVIYTRRGRPVVIERKFGAGTMVMASDSYFLSNEALLKDRHADLVSWWIGSNKHIVFDEAHLGVVESPGVAGLIRKYRLHGLVIGLILLAGLFIWKNSANFVPPYAEESKPDFVPGKDSTAGFVNLLRRNISSGELLDLCFAEWKKSLGHGNRHLEGKQAQIQALLDAEKARPKLQRDPVQLYREICGIVKDSQR